MNRLSGTVLAFSLTLALGFSFGISTNYTTAKTCHKTRG